MRALLDVSVLLALFDPVHIHHRRAMTWWSGNRADGWASCPMTQNGFLRIASQSSYPNPFPLPQATATLRAQIAKSDHTFWPDNISLLDDSLIDHSRVLGPRQLTDIYILALAVHNGGRLVTLDTSISPAAVKGAHREHLVVVA